ncbi:hypothetical protein [Dactylosporangium sp. NPDC050588]|uniref:hypothetical protein n=1 Tax=Dactylosporangium sp. NPDC050588 TaxID=3157211 RepID=UPI0033CE182D
MRRVAADLAARALVEAGDDRDARARALVASIQAAWTPARDIARTGELLGRPPRTYESFVRATAADWSAGQRPD